MYIGTEVTFTHVAGQNNSYTITPSSEVSGFQFNHTGFTSLLISYTGYVKTYELYEGWNIITFPNTSVTINVGFIGTGTTNTSNWSFYKTFIDFTKSIDHSRPIANRPIFESGSEALGDRSQSYATNERINAQFRYEWRNLSWTKVDQLEELFDRLGVLGNPVVTLIPDDTQGDSYDVVITSDFNFFQTNESDFNLGASGALIFETVNPIAP